LLILKPEGLFLCIVAAVIMLFRHLLLSPAGRPGSKAAGWASGGTANV
jgi:hypothetical protein